MIKKDICILAIELDSVWTDKTANLNNLEHTLSTIERNVDIVVLPEMFSTGFVINDKVLIESLAERNSGETMCYIEKLSKKYGTAIAGTFIANTSGVFSNRAFFVEPSGDAYFYDKHILFSMGNEQEYYSAGAKNPPIIRFRGWNILPVICYEIRFPEWIRNLDNKYDLMLIMANWPKAREYSWKHLLIARAIENECYVCGVNRTGTDNNNIIYPESSSMIIDYKGKDISDTITGKPIKICICCGEELIRFRERFPAWKDAQHFDFTH